LYKQNKLGDSINLFTTHGHKYRVKQIFVKALQAGPSYLFRGCVLQL